MNRTWSWMVAWSVAAAAAACNGTTSRPAAVPVNGNVAAASQAADRPTKPDKTDPAAEAVIDKLLAAHTGGKLDRLAALRSHKSVRKGKFEGPGAAVWTVQAIWPDRFRTQGEFLQLGGGLNMKVRNGSTWWNLLPTQGITQPTPMTTADIDTFKADIYAEWVALLVPFAEREGRVAVPVASGDVAGKPASGVRVWIGDHSPVTLRVDANDHLVRIEYEISDGIGLVPISITINERKEVNGVLLPTKSAYVVNNRPISTWDHAEYEFPATFPPTVFEQP